VKLNNCLLIFLFVLLSGCSYEENFTCDGTGLSISKKTASYGPSTLLFCDKSGVISTYKYDCKSADSFILLFDTVSHQITTFTPKITSSFRITECSKVTANRF